MSKPLHYLLLVGIVVVCAVVSAFTVHKLLTSSRTAQENSVVNKPQPRKTFLSPDVTVTLPKDASGVYVLPSTDPRRPLQLGPNTVGGSTACERLTNLALCLKVAESPFVSRAKMPEASSGATLEEACGSVLVGLDDLREETAELGCIW